MPLPRNPVIRAGAILRKGGAHVKSVSGTRHRGKLDLRDEIDEWFEESDDSDLTTHQRKAEGGGKPPSRSQPALISAILKAPYSLTAIR